MIKDFYTKFEGDSKFAGYKVPEDVYDANESIFFKLILSTKKNIEMEQKYKI